MKGLAVLPPKRCHRSWSGTAEFRRARWWKRNTMTLVLGSVLLGGVGLVRSSAGAWRVGGTTRSRPGAAAPVAIETSSLARGSCGTGFRSHTLAHTTQARDVSVLPYDTNGSGLAVGDLDGDGQTDLVLGDLRSSTSVMWNAGGFRFIRKPLQDAAGVGLPESETRAVSIVDVDGDGRLDIVTTHTRGGVAVWHNDGDRTFTSSTIDDVIFPAYSMLWDDIDGDGDLDFVTASYDALLEKEEGSSFLTSAGGGVNVFINSGRGFRATRLAKATQTLAMTMFDTNGDGKRDLIVGNDFGVPDMIWEVNGADPKTWKLSMPFRRISKNTMGFAIGDLRNDAMLDLFATDMKPNLADVKIAASWMPLMERSFQKLQRSNVQRAENVLQEQSKSATFVNKGYEKHVDATGWSWSAQFGDLDNDGREDLYVVNGMIDHEVLPYLPNDEIAEPNVVFRVDSSNSFHRTPSWGLNAMASGRSMAMADFNGDGRLDIVVNNLRSPSVIFENQLCGGTPMTIRLRWSGKQNVSGFGSMVTVRTTAGTFTRLVNPTGGYLTGLDGLVQVGLGGAKVESIDVTWPDGAKSTIRKTDTPSQLAGTAVTLTRNG